MNNKYGSVNNIAIDAHDVRALKDGGYILVTLLYPFNEFAGSWNMTAPNGDCMKVTVVDSFKSIAKFKLEKEDNSIGAASPLE